MRGFSLEDAGERLVAGCTELPHLVDGFEEANSELHKRWIEFHAACTDKGVLGRLFMTLPADLIDRQRGKHKNPRLAIEKWIVVQANGTPMASAARLQARSHIPSLPSLEEIGGTMELSDSPQRGLTVIRAPQVNFGTAAIALTVPVHALPSFEINPLQPTYQATYS